MIEAVMIWNEPNNKSHWDPEIDPGWHRFAEMAIKAGRAVADARPGLPRVLGGISPIDPQFVAHMGGLGVLDEMDVVAVHGFPLDWNVWSIHDWPAKLDEIRAVTALPVWVSEVGVSSFGVVEAVPVDARRAAGKERGGALEAPRLHLFGADRKSVV